MTKNTLGCIGLALAGHSARACGDQKQAAKYANPLTNFIDLIIAEAKARQGIKENTLLCK